MRAWLFDNKTRLLLALMVSGIFAGTLRSMGDADIWFQLLAGKYALRHGAVPHTDFFIYTASDAPQMFGGWGFGLVYQLAIDAFGLTAATAVNSIIWTAAFVFAMLAAFKRAGLKPGQASSMQLTLMMVVVSALFISMAMRMSMRAESTLVLAWTASLWLFESLRSRRPQWIFIALPLVAWAEAWLHTGGFVLLALLPICIARQMSGGPLGARQWGLWALCALGCLLLPLLNPNGALQVYIQFQNIFSMLTWDAQHSASELKMLNLEYLPIWDPRAVVLVAKFAVLSLLALAVSARPPNRGSAVESALCWACLATAALHVRGMSLAGMVVMVPAMEAALHPWTKKTPPRDALFLALSALLCLAPWATSNTLSNAGIQGRSTGMEDEAATIKATHPHGANIFTNEIGPQLAYTLGDERFMVSKGGHTIIEHKQTPLHIQRVTQGEEGWLEELDKNHVDFVCLPFYLPMPGQGFFYWLPSQLVTRDDWQLILKDGGTPLFRRMPPNEKLSAAAVEHQTLIYLQNISIFKNFSLYGVPDMVAQEIGAAAQEKIHEIEQKHTKKMRD